MQRRAHNGFTFLELLLVVAIILTLGVFSTGYYARFLNQNAVINNTDQLVGELRKAQMYAMMGRQNSNWGVRYSANKITLFAASSSAFDESFTVNNSVSITGFTQVIFARATGIPDAANVITISSQNNTKTVTINAQGMVTR